MIVNIYIFTVDFEPLESKGPVGNGTNKLLVMKQYPFHRFIRGQGHYFWSEFAWKLQHFVIADLAKFGIQSMSDLLREFWVHDRNPEVVC